LPVHRELISFYSKTYTNGSSYQEKITHNTDGSPRKINIDRARERIPLIEYMKESNNAKRMETDCLKNQMKVLKNQLRANSTSPLLSPTYKDRYKEISIPFNQGMKPKIL
jgi:hypothetical protein